MNVYVPDVLEKMETDPLLVPDRLELARKYVREGKFLLGGTFADPLDSGAAVFKTDSKSDVEDFVNADPYKQKGLVTCDKGHHS
ncbi:unnamed protein product [Orchesella dallaii]|uniref:YCII-related domain-containing protein n=1 Tax=Orchesella dallaii TaxID=48710 RepID=A0ABP1QTP5_9HEXA